MPESRSFLTVDIGGTKTAVAVGFADARIADRVEFGTSDPRTTMGRILELARPLAARHAVEAIGISCGGPLSSRDGLVLGPPNLPGWDRVPVVRALEEGLGRPAFLENDANAGALAEWMFGAGRGFQNVVFLTCGTGIGAGLILDGRLYRGKQDMAGEVGHVRMEADGPVGYFKAGSLEGFASGGGMLQLAKRRLAEPHPATVLDEGPAGELTGPQIGQAALDGDAVARSIVETSGRYLGKGLAILIDILNPECIVLGSLAVRLGELLLGPAREEVQREALAPAWRNCRIVPAELRGHIGDVAALCAAIYSLKEAETGKEPADVEQ